jgi:hypothetical protein
MTRERDAFSKSTLSSSEISWWKIDRRWTTTAILHGIEGVVPIAMPIGVFTTKPTQEVPVVKIEAQKGAGIKQSSVHRELLWRTRGWATNEEASDGIASSSNSKSVVEKPLRTDLYGEYLVMGFEVLPSKMKKDVG